MVRAAVEIPTLHYTADLLGTRQIVSVSPAFARLTGVTTDEWLSTSAWWRDVVHPEDREYVLAENERCLRTGAAFHAVYRIHPPSGVVRWVRDDGRYGDSGGMVGAVVDVTDEHQVAQYQYWRNRYRSAQAEVERLARADEARQTALKVLVHDLRTSLVAAGGLVAVTQSDAVPDEMREALLLRVGRTLEQAQSLMDAFVEIQRLAAQATGELDLVPTDVGQLLSGIVQTKDQGLHEIVVHVESHTLDMQPLLVTRAVSRLIDNALAHTPAGSTVWTRVVPLSDGALLVVDDDGPGVPDSDKQRIFAPFDRGSAPPERGGLGLGLALVADVARLHGGEVWVDDRAGGGASFSLFIPSIDGASA